MPSSLPSGLLAAGLLTMAACDRSNDRTAPLVPTSPTSSARSAVLSGAADGVAFELLLAGRSPLVHAVQLSDAALGDALQDIALDHLRSVAFAPNGGPALRGADAFRALAAQPDAPSDRNHDGSNLDETLAQELQRVASRAGGQVPEAGAPPLLPWRLRSAALSAPLAAGTPPWPTEPLGQDRATMVEIAQFVRLRVAAASHLLTARRGMLVGADADRGVLGLLVLQQALSAEATLFTSLFGSGGPLGPLNDPASYEPTPPRWLPAELLVGLDPQHPDLAANWRAADAASDLVAIAAWLQTAAELTVASREDAALRDLWEVGPFKLPPPGPAPKRTSWSLDVGPLLAFRCGSCHGNGQNGGFSVATMQQMLLGGNRTRLLNIPMVVPGDHAASFLHRVLVGPPPPFFRMPFGQPPLPAAEIDLIARWIDEGAHELPATAPPPPRPGEHLLRVQFANLSALHFDAATGALQHRHEPDGGSGCATALATGHALAALAAAADVAPQLTQQGLDVRQTMQLAAAFAASHLLDATGQACEVLDLQTFAREGTARLRSQAALAAGLLAATRDLPSTHATAVAARLCFARLLDIYREHDYGLFHEADVSFPARYDAELLADLFAALRIGAARGLPGARYARLRLLERLRPSLAFAEWEGHGEVFGDGVPDTDRDGLREPAAAGDAFGRLPMIIGAIEFTDGQASAPLPVTWSAHVRPLLLQKCGECHLLGAAEGGYRLDTRRLAATPGQSGGTWPLLVPGDADGSLLWQKLVSRAPPTGAQMPFARPPLDAAATALVRQWIQEGANSR